MRSYTFHYVKRCGLRRKNKASQNQRQSMASFHCSAKIGSKGGGGRKAEYNLREGRYQGYDRYEDLAAKGSLNMPKWAAGNPVDYWKAADEFEGKKGQVYRELELALPRELTLEQNKALLADYIERVIGKKYPVAWAIHDKQAALDEGGNMHAHVLRGMREVDGIDRDPKQTFKRYDSAKPERGGGRKNSGRARWELKQELLEERKLWADVQNEHLEKHGHSVRVDHRSYEEQGIDRVPEIHLGPARIAKMTDEEIADLLEVRAIEGERQRAEAELQSSIIDLSGDIKAAQKSLIEQKADAFTKQAEQRMQQQAEAAKAAQREKEAAERAEQQRADREMQEKRAAYLAAEAAKLDQAKKHQVNRPAPKKKGPSFDGPGMG